MRHEDEVQLVVTCDEHYVGPLRTLLTSIAVNSPDDHVHVWLLHSSVSPGCLADLARFCSVLDMDFSAHAIDRALFEDARVSTRYPQEMYYRLLAPLQLDVPGGRMLYMDPDTLVINPLHPLWDLELHGAAFAAASHLDADHIVTGLNNIRLDTDHEYFNTGVILMDVPAAREVINTQELFAYANEHELSLMFPDQDLFNSLYGRYALPVEDVRWNYDARKYSDYLVRTAGESTMEWVMAHTSILHFCGRSKPWAHSHRGRFGALYRNYMQIAVRAQERATAKECLSK